MHQKHSVKPEIGCHRYSVTYLDSLYLSFRHKKPTNLCCTTEKHLEPPLKLEFFLSLRYFITKKRRSSISLISVISIVCVALAVTVLIVVFSVMNGFHEDMKQKILSKESHVVLKGYRSAPIEDYKKICQEVAKLKEVKLALPYYEGQGLIQFGNSSWGAHIRGVVPDLVKRDPDFQTKFKVKGALPRIIQKKPFEERLLTGLGNKKDRVFLKQWYKADRRGTSYTLKEKSTLATREKLDQLIDKSGFRFDLSWYNNIIVGDILAARLGLSVGDNVTLFVPPAQGNDALLPVTYQYRVAGIFTAGHADYDQYFVFMNIRDAQRLFGVGDTASAIGVKIRNIHRAALVKREVNRVTGYRYRTLTWMMDRRNLYQALITEKSMIGVVLFFLIALAAFSIASTLIMVVMEKEREIGILKSMGMKPAAIKRIFIFQGFIVGLIGTLIGLFLGLLIASTIQPLLKGVESAVNSFNRDFFELYKNIFQMPFPVKWELFPAEVYYVTSFQVRIQFVEIFLICLGSVLLTSLCAFIPANQAARLSVTEVLHKE